jgi:hypothetical protein
MHKLVSTLAAAFIATTFVMGSAFAQTAASTAKSSTPAVITGTTPAVPLENTVKATAPAAVASVKTPVSVKKPVEYSKTSKAKKEEKAKDESATPVK